MSERKGCPSNFAKCPCWQDMLEDMASWLLQHGPHVTSLSLAAHPPGPREEGRTASWRERQLWVTATACLAACAGSLERLCLRWHEDLDLSHHFRLLRRLTALTAASDSAISPDMLVGHTALRCARAGLGVGGVMSG
jgi:hypothetical protein